MESLRDKMDRQLLSKYKRDKNSIIIEGAKQHNLKNVNLRIPKNKLVVFTGVSGSGKSTLVFDTIFAEAQRRFMAGFSSFVRKYLDKVEKPKVDYIYGLTPVISIKQKGVSNNPRSTVATITGIADYLRLLYSRIGIRKCLKCGSYIIPKDIGTISTSTHELICPKCHSKFPCLGSQHFSANTPSGACHECGGLGIKHNIYEENLIGNPEVSILDGALKWFGNLRDGKKTTWPTGPLDVLYNHYNLDIETPWNKLPDWFHNIIFYGSGKEKLKYKSTLGMKETYKIVPGLIPELTRLYYDTDSEYNRKRYEQYMTLENCTVCDGTGLNIEAQNVIIGEKNIVEIEEMSIKEVLKWIEEAYRSFPEDVRRISDEIAIEIYKRLCFLDDVGLGYLTLSRTAPTLSGGEGQRVRLASQLSSGIVGVTYILDEPSAGLHSKDVDNLIKTLLNLREQGNSVLVVEHDKSIMESADLIVDVGPKAGILGGNIVAEGTPKEILNNDNSITGKYLSGKLSVSMRKTPLKIDDKTEWLVLSGANCNNLKNVNLHIPLGRLTCITGVSGSGKSSLIEKTLKPIMEKLLNGERVEGIEYNEVKGYESFEKMIDVSQEPIGRTPRSNPATYTGLFDKIRKVFAVTEYAKEHGFTADYFSFNSKKGRCEACEGQGQVKIDMHFLSDVWVTCDKCKGTRFRDEILKCKIKEKSIADVLEMDMKEALDFFSGNKEIEKILKTFGDVGLEYMKLGQSALTLSGGEAQRVKLAKELSKKTKGKMLYIFDEPTTGLHFEDIRHLLDIFEKLVLKGHTLVVIEHNMEVISEADWIIDMGPEGGAAGGEIVAEASPKDLINVKASYTGKALKEYRKTE